MLGADRMKYRNACSMLPEDLLELIKEYVQREYIYISIKDKYATECALDYKTELEKRDAYISTKYLEGMSKKRLSKIYNLSESSLRRIIIKKWNEYTSMNDKIIKILFHWGLQKSEVKQIHNTAWQVGDRYVLKVYQEYGLLERNLKIISILNEMSIPVGNIVSIMDKNQYVLSDQDFYFLSEKLPGNNIVRSGMTER